MNPLAGTSLEKEEGCLGLQIPRMPKLGLVHRRLWDAFCYHLREFLLQQTSASSAGQKFWLCFFEAVVTTGILYFGLCMQCLLLTLQPTQLCMLLDVWVINLVTLIYWNNLLVN